jgi:hypothetical protein
VSVAAPAPSPGSRPRVWATQTSKFMWEGCLTGSSQNTRWLVQPT